MIHEGPALIEPPEGFPASIPAMFARRVARSPDAVATHAGSGTRTWARCALEVGGAVQHLRTLGVRRGDRVAILGNPHPEWLTLDLAIQSLGAVPVGIYPTLPDDDITTILDDAGVTLRFAEPSLLRPGWLNWEMPNLAPFVPPDPADDAADAICTLIYTSGTTGRPKGVILSQRAMVRVCYASCQAMPLTGSQRSIVYLPLAHSLARMTVYRSFLEDIEGWWCPSFEALPKMIPIARPTVLIAVPRVLEKMQAKVEAGIAERPVWVQQLLAWALKQPGRIGERVRARIRDRLGGLSVIGVGGAALNPQTGAFFERIGIRVIEGWGLSETCAPATQNPPGAPRLGTVGVALPGTAWKLAEDGEVWLCGVGLFSGYWGGEVAQEWFATGDIGEHAGDGYLRIVDRKKELIVTSGGKNVAPVPIEARLCGPEIEQAVVIGNERPYLVALVVPSGVGDVEAAIARANAGRPSFEQVRRWVAIPELSVENGCLTPTLKLRRRVIVERYAFEIAGLYS